MQARGHSRTILTVDDHPVVLDLLKNVLEKSGFRVLTAGNGAEALELFISAPEQIDLVITDLVMPEMDGSRLADHLSQLKPELPVLFISGYADRLERLRGPVLHKPFTSSTLLSKIRILLPDP